MLSLQACSRKDQKGEESYLSAAQAYGDVSLSNLVHQHDHRERHLRRNLGTRTSILNLDLRLL